MRAARPAAPVDAPAVTPVAPVAEVAPVVSPVALVAVPVAGPVLPADARVGNVDHHVGASGAVVAIATSNTK